jgi:fumarylacetoacetate (FAA) hydrolase
MKLATLRDGTRDGALVVVRHDGAAFARAHDVARTLQAALDAWEATEPACAHLRTAGRGEDRRRALDVRQLHARCRGPTSGWTARRISITCDWCGRRGRRAPPTLETDPLVYQGGSGVLLGPTEDLTLPDPGWWMDFESEIVVVLGDVPMGTKAAEAGRYVRLVTQCNDVSLRNLIPPELAKGFGFFQSKPATAFGPFAVTPDELGPAWRDGRAQVRVRSTLNGKVVGETDAGPEMHFSFFQLLEHVARTRAFTAGTLLGSGTVSNEDRARGISCLAERRMIETIEQGKPTTPFMSVGDRIEIETFDAAGRSLFGRIAQTVRAPR